jgi:hypothetical protein
VQVVGKDCGVGDVGEVLLVPNCSGEALADLPCQPVGVVARGLHWGAAAAGCLLAAAAASRAGSWKQPHLPHNGQRRGEGGDSETEGKGASRSRSRSSASRSSDDLCIYSFPRSARLAAAAPRGTDGTVSWH